MAKGLTASGRFIGPSALASFHGDPTEEAGGSTSGIDAATYTKAFHDESSSIDLASSGEFVDLGEGSQVRVHLKHAAASDPWVVAARQRIQELLSLLPNWNGGSERAVHPSAVARTFDLLDALHAAGVRSDGWIVPLHDGGLQIEWRSASAEVEVEVPPEGPAVAFAEFEDESIEWSIDSTPDGPQQLLTALARVSQE